MKLSDATTNKLNKVLNPNRFRFVVILYNNTNEIKSIKEYVKDTYSKNSHVTLDLKSKSYADVADIIYGAKEGFVYIDDLDEVLKEDKLYIGFNQRRDKIASHSINLVTFYSKTLESTLYKTAVDVLPDLWEFRSPIISLEDDIEKESILKDENRQGGSYSSLGGLTTKDKLKEIERLKKSLDNTTSQELKLNVLDQLSQLYNEVGKYAEAITYTKDALKIQEEVLGVEHLDTAANYSNLASLYQSMGEYEKALSFFQKSIKIQEETLGGNYPNIAASYNNLASLYQSMGEYEKALSFFQKSIKIQEEAFGWRHPNIATSYNNLASLYESMEQYDKALSIFSKYLKIREEVLGEEHPDTAASYNNLASLYQSMGEYEKALSFNEKSMIIQEKILGEEHPDTATSYNNLSRLYFDIGNYNQSYYYLQKAIKILEKVLPENHGTLVDMQSGLDMINKKLGEMLQVDKKVGRNEPCSCGSRKKYKKCCGK